MGSFDAYLQRASLKSQKSSTLKVMQQVTQTQSRPHLLSGWRFHILVAATILTAFGYLFFTLWGGRKDVYSAFTKFGLEGVSIVLLISSTNYLFRYARWQMLLSLLGHRIPILRGFSIYLSGFALTITPSKAGEAIRNIFLVDEGVPHRQSLGVMLAERFADLIGVVLLSMFGFFAYSEGRTAIMITTLILLFCLYALQQDRWIRSFEKLMDRILPERFSNGIDFFLETIMHLRTCFKIWPMLMGIGLGVLAWGAEAFAFYMLIQYLGYEMPLNMAIFIYSFSLLIATITFLPGGVGGAEVALLNLLLLQDVAFSDAIAITIIIRLCTLWFSVLLGLVTLPMNRVNIK